MTFRLIWSGVWLGVLAAFAVSYHRLDMARRETARRALIGKLEPWRSWSQWRDSRIAEEFNA